MKTGERISGTIIEKEVYADGSRAVLLFIMQELDQQLRCVDVSVAVASYNSCIIDASRIIIPTVASRRVAVDAWSPLHRFISCAHAWQVCRRKLDTFHLQRAAAVSSFILPPTTRRQRT